MTDESTFEQGRFKVRVVTPEQILVDTDATSVTLPGAAGILEVMPGASPLLTSISAGDLIIGGAESGGEQKFVIARGFAEVLPDRVTIMAEYAETPDHVDKAAAEQQLQDGEKQVREAGDDPGRYAAGRLTVLEAEARLGRAGQ